MEFYLNSIVNYRSFKVRVKRILNKKNFLIILMSKYRFNIELDKIIHVYFSDENSSSYICHRVCLKGKMPVVLRSGRARRARV